MTFGRGPLQAAFKKGFCNLVYVTGGYPTKEKTIDVLMSLQESGCVDVVEVGVPFTDPVGDGPVIEECALASISGDCKSIFTVIELIKEARKVGFNLPVILMGYYNTFRPGWIEASKDCISGVIIVDLPFEEPFTHELKDELNKSDISFIPLASPFTSGERLNKISGIVDTFLYNTCVMGVTGARQSLDEYLQTTYQATWKKIKDNTDDKKCILGFGISNNRAVKAVRVLGADGLVVGSALMRKIIEVKELSGQDLRKAISDFLNELFAQ